MCRDSEYRENNHNSLRVEHVNAFEFSSTTYENIRLPSCSYIEHVCLSTARPLLATETHLLARSVLFVGERLTMPGLIAGSPGWLLGGFFCSPGWL